MARYIDADKLVEMYDRSAKDDWNKKTAPSSWAEAFDCAIADIDDQPTADVVPRAELAREIILEVDALICCHANGDIDDKRLYLFFDELKKKYTEAQHETRN